ncbi:farnesol dehydrogenase-like [Linepithema humile]|uniref:farnesol dehydrogenase-like n=1 Tax=Linepithema humile TaxID=83485 RepID=UPI0006231D58|nr:PREDICTED: farnesol dehydrogenase-like isoform X3 [Linepithema humile]
MERWAGKVALVTGASVGIGAKVTRALAENGMKVIAVARRLENLQQLAASLKREFKAEVYPMQCDVRQEKDILNVFQWAEKELGGVDVLINNAGVTSTQSIIEGSTDEYHKILDVNVIAAAICSRQLTQSVKKRKASGHIININSIAGHYASNMVMPLSVYCASKYAITGMTETLRNEVKVAQVDVIVTSISPGVVKTDMVLDNFPEAEKNLPMLHDKDIADAVIYCLQVPPRVQIWEITLAPNNWNINDFVLARSKLSQKPDEVKK